MHITPQSIAVIGAGLAGLRSAERLRAAGYAGTITMIGREDALPYDRPPLSKQVLNGTWEVERATLRDDEAFAELDVELRRGVSAVGLHGRTVLLDDGSEITPDAVIIATGVAPRTLPGQPDGVVTLRTSADAVALRDSLARSKSLIIVGGGFIAAEVATAARQAGVAVTVVEAEEVPCARAIGSRAGGLVARLFEEAGVDLRCSTVVERFLDAQTVELSDGEKLQADQILVSVGAAPDLSWVTDPAVPLGDGILCGSTGRIEPLPCVWALGDVAAWWDQPRRRHARTEHWTSVGEQASAVAADLLGLETPVPPLPYVWSDQFGLKLQVIGRPDLADDVRVLHGAGLDGGEVKGTVLGHHVGDALVAVTSFGAPALMMRHRSEVVAGTASITVIAVPDDD